MQPLAHEVGQIAEREDIGGAVERQAVLEGQALAGFHFVADRTSDGGSSNTTCMLFRHPV